MNVIIDTDILSTFIKIDKLNLLQRLFAKATILLTPAVYKELKRGERQGLIQITLSRRFSRPAPIQAEKRMVREMVDRGFSKDDSECIAFAHHRNCLLVTNDVYIKNEAMRLSIERIDLTALLRMLWKSHVISKDQTQILMDEIEKKDNIIIKNKELILRLIFKTSFHTMIN